MPPSSHGDNRFQVRRLRGALWFLAVCLVGVAPAGCGYRFSRPETGLAEGVRTVSAPMMVNQTSEPGVEMFFTQALRTQLQRAGVEVSRTSLPEAEIRGELLAISDVANLPNRCGTLATYRLTATARLRLVKQERVLSEVVVTGAEEFLPGGTPRCGPGGQLLEAEHVDPILSLERNRDVALRHLAEELMRDGYDRLASGF